MAATRRLASEHLLTFRSGAAGFCDLGNDGGTGNFGGFRAGCTNNLIVADGVLTAPDYTRNCTCSYQNQCSLALVPMPEAEMWTFQGTRKVEGVIRRAGVNLGAPGNRKADDGTLWLEHPRAGGPSPRLAVTTVPANPQWFRRHSSQVAGEWNWVAASGARGLRSLTLSLGEQVRPTALVPGASVFHGTRWAGRRPASLRHRSARPHGLTGTRHQPRGRRTTPNARQGMSRRPRRSRSNRSP